MAAPEPGRGCLHGELAAQSLTGSLDKLQTQSTVSLAKSRCAERRPLGIERTLDQPGAHFGDDVLTSHARVKHLKEKGPEESRGSVNSLTLGLGIRSIGEELLREKGAEQSGEIGQGEVSKVVDAFSEDAGRGRLGFTLEEMREVGEK